MKKICVYTVITGDYDNLKEIQYKEKCFDYICLTNNKNIKSKTWKVIYVKEDESNLLLSRKLKILFYKYLSDYEWTIYIDGAINVLKPISEFINNCCDLNKYEMISFKHGNRDCTYDEINACVYHRKINIEDAKKVEKFLTNENYPKHNGLRENSVLIRKNTNNIVKLMNMWYEKLCSIVIRDQLFLDYCIWKMNFETGLIDLNVQNNDYFYYDDHVKNFNKLQKECRIYFDKKDLELENFHYKDIIIKKYTIDSISNGLDIKIKKNTNEIYVMFINEVGNILDKIKVDKKIKYELYNFYHIDGTKYFSSASIVIFKSKFKKGENLNIKLNIKNLKREELMHEFFENNLQNKFQIKRILNFKNWKLIKSLRKNIK